MIMHFPNGMLPYRAINMLHKDRFYTKIYNKYLFVNIPQNNDVTY